jgi:uncharacterized membrane protein
MLCLSGLFYIFPLLVHPKNFSRMKVYWLTTSFFTLSLQAFLLIFYLYFGFPFIYPGVTIIMMCVLIYIQYLHLKSLRESVPEEGLTEDMEQAIDILGMFYKPKHITEEEVSISKEKKICLVCKGNVGGIMFMCTNCDSLYCIKCSDALSSLENACWVCNTPFNESKPSKPYKIDKVEDKIEVAGETPKKKNKHSAPLKRKKES